MPLFLPQQWDKSSFMGGLEDFSYGGFLIDFLGEEGDQSSLTDYRVEEL